MVDVKMFSGPPAVGGAAHLSTTRISRMNCRSLISNTWCNGRDAEVSELLYLYVEISMFLCEYEFLVFSTQVSLYIPANITSKRYEK